MAGNLAAFLGTDNKGFWCVPEARHNHQSRVTRFHATVIVQHQVCQQLEKLSKTGQLWDVCSVETGFTSAINKALLMQENFE